MLPRPTAAELGWGPALYAGCRPALFLHPFDSLECLTCIWDPYSLSGLRLVCRLLSPLLWASPLTLCNFMVLLPIVEQDPLSGILYPTFYEHSLGVLAIGSSALSSSLLKAMSVFLDSGL